MEALREQERILEQRIDGLEGKEFEPEDVAWYVALKPVPHTWLPGLDERFLPYLLGESPLGVPVELGPKLSEAEVDATRRSNRSLAFGLWALGALVFGLGSFVAVSTAPSMITAVNFGLVSVVGIRVALGVVATRRTYSWVRIAAPRFYGLRPPASSA